jgi:ribosomal protein S10
MWSPKTIQKITLQAVIFKKATTSQHRFEPRTHSKWIISTHPKKIQVLIYPKLYSKPY